MIKIIIYINIIQILFLYKNYQYIQLIIILIIEILFDYMIIII